MAEVISGAKTMKHAGGKKPLPDRLRSVIADAEAKKDMVIFVGTCDYLPVVSPDYKYSTNGKVIGMDEVGVILEFSGEQTREYDLSDTEDLLDVEAVRRWINRGRDDRIRRFSIAERPASLPRQPFVGFDSFSVNQLQDFVAAISAEEADPDAFIEQCIAYEASKDTPRTEVIEMLGGVTDDPVDEDIIEAEVNL